MIERLILWQFITVFVEAETGCLLCNEVDEYLVSR